MEQWILCSDSLPPELDDNMTDNVLIYTKSPKDPDYKGVYLGYYDYREKQWYTCARCFFSPISEPDIGLEEDVVAWQKIIEPTGI